MAVSRSRVLSLCVFLASGRAVAGGGVELLATGSGDRVNITAWGTNALRVRIGLGGAPIVDKPGALIAPGEDNKGHPVLATAPTQRDGSVESVSRLSDGRVAFTNGDITAVVSPDGMVTVTRVSDGKVVLRELSRVTVPPSSAPAITAPAPTPPVWYTVAVNNSAAACSGGPCCLDVTNWHTQPGSNVAVSNCHWDGATKDSNQRWLPDGSGHLAAASCNLCLAVGKTQVEIDACSSDNTWAFPQPGNTGPITQKSSGLCLQPEAGKDGGRLTTVKCSASEPLQQWTIEVAGKSPPPPPPPPTRAGTTETFESVPDEGIFGFGEHQQGRLNNKGVTYDMESCLEYGKSHGGEVCLPYILCTNVNASRVSGYGFLWNMPNYGGVSFNPTSTAWTATAATQIDYFVAIGTGDLGSVMHSYVDAVGHAPMLPDYAAGYWHSKNRYSSQAELLEAAQTFHNLNINVSIIVIDYHHWVNMGDWSFDPASWPDVPGMMKNLTQLGMRVMVSAWPFSAVGSSSIDEVQSKGYGVTVQNSSEPSWWDDNNCNAKCLLYDATQADAREYVWSRLAEGYYQHGIKIFWLDASEPEISTHDAQAAADFYNNSLGTGQETGMMFPYFHTRTIHDGLVSEGEAEVVMLTRSAWAGMQRWGAALWSGDTSSHWGSLQVSIPAGLNTQLSGIAWWTTDIGGYAGGNPTDPDFRELIVRWFEFGVTCPLFRQHGARPTEPWLLGNVSFPLVEKIIRFRYSIQDYVLQQMEAVSQTGMPVNRPLWFDFPSDPLVRDITTSYMFGDAYLVAPITEPNVTTQTLYLPSVAGGWTHLWTNQTFAGGANVTVPAPLGNLPIFKRSV